MEIREAAIAAMGRTELEELIDRAVRPDVPLRVLFAALDRYTELLRPTLDDEPEQAAAAEPAGTVRPVVVPPVAVHPVAVSLVPPVAPVWPVPPPAPGPPVPPPTGPPGPPE